MSAAEPQLKVSNTDNYKLIRERVDALVKSEEVEIPVLPEVAARVVALASGADSNSQLLSRLITADPALASHVMRVAASAAYLPSTPLVSLQQAITWLGLSEVANIAFTVAVQGKILNVAVPLKSIVLNVWRESVATGVWSREMAGLTHTDPGAGYLCGLLHEIGKPVILRAIAEVSQKSKIPLSSAELMQIVNEYHVPVGELIVREWKLPEAIGFVLKYWNDPLQATQYRREATATGVARRLTEFALNDDSELARNGVMEDQRNAELGLNADAMTALLNRTERVLAQVRMY